MLHDCTAVVYPDLQKSSTTTRFTTFSLVGVIEGNVCCVDWCRSSDQLRFPGRAPVFLITEPQTKGRCTIHIVFGCFLQETLLVVSSGKEFSHWQCHTLKVACKQYCKLCVSTIVEVVIEIALWPKSSTRDLLIRRNSSCTSSAKSQSTHHESRTRLLDFLARKDKKFVPLQPLILYKPSWH